MRTGHPTYQRGKAIAAAIARDLHCPSCDGTPSVWPGSGFTAAACLRDGCTASHQPRPIAVTDGPDGDVASVDYAEKVPARQALPPLRGDEPKPDPDAARDLAGFARVSICRYCGHIGLTPHWRSKFLNHPPGTWSLAGVQDKTVATLVAWPWLGCDGCGHVSEAQS